MPRTIIVRKPRRSGKWWILGANCYESRLGKNKGVHISIPIPNTHKNNLNGRGTNIDTNHIPAPIENPIEYLVISLAVQILGHVFWCVHAIYQKMTRIIRVRECKPAGVFT